MKIEFFFGLEIMGTIIVMIIIYGIGWNNGFNYHIKMIEERECTSENYESFSKIPTECYKYLDIKE